MTFLPPQSTETDDINEKIRLFNATVQKSVGDTLDTVFSKYIFEGRNFKEWTEWFNVSIEDDDDYDTLIRKAKLVSNLLDECQNNYARAKAASSYYAYHEYVNNKHAISHSAAKSLRGKERDADDKNAAISASKQQTDIFFEFFETQLWKLRNKAKAIDSLVMSENTLIKHLKSKFQNHL